MREHEKLERVHYADLVPLTPFMERSEFESFTRPLWKEHHAACHGAGVVFGLDVESRGRSLVVSPGVAIDGTGELIVLSENGGGMLARNPDRQTDVPVTIAPTSDMYGEWVIVTIEKNEQHIPRPADVNRRQWFPAGSMAHMPLVQLLHAPVTASQVVLAVAKISESGAVERVLPEATEIPGVKREAMANRSGGLSLHHSAAASVGKVAERASGSLRLAKNSDTDKAMETLELGVADGVPNIRISREGARACDRLELFANKISLYGDITFLESRFTVDGRKIAEDGRLLDALMLKIQGLEKRVSDLEQAGPKTHAFSPADSGMKLKLSDRAIFPSNHCLVLASCTLVGINAPAPYDGSILFTVRLDSTGRCKVAMLGQGSWDFSLTYKAYESSKEIGYFDGDTLEFRWRGNRPLYVTAISLTG